MRISFRTVGIRRWFTRYFLAKVLLALTLVTVSAANLTVTTNTNQAEIGGALNVTNRLVAVDKGFFVAGSSSTASGTTCATATKFGIGTISNTNVTILHNVYDIAANETLTTDLNACYKATLVLTPSGGSATTYGPVYMNSTASILSTFRIDCRFDIGASPPASPYSFQLTIQQAP